MIVGKIISLDIKQARKRRFFEITINDGSGTLKCIWFRGLSWISEKFSLNETIAVYGKIEFYNGFRLIHPEFDMLDDNEDPINTGKIISIYPSNTDLKSVGIDSRGFRRLLNSAIEKSKSSISDFGSWLSCMDTHLSVTTRSAFSTATTGFGSMVRISEL